MSQDISVIHAELLVLLKRLHCFCVKNKINYSLHGGTLLGAVREKGFIEWDDDADITMDRRNFNRFCRLIKKARLPEDMAFAADSRYPKLVMMRKGKPCVWADIFVYDFISQRPYAQKLKLMGTSFFILLTRTKEEQKMSNLHGLYKGYKKLIMNAAVYASQIIPFNARLSLAKWFMTRLPGNRTLVHRSNDTRVGMSLILPASINDEYMLADFEQEQLMIIKDYDTLLRSSYGDDYMTPRKDKPDEMHQLTLKKEQQELAEYILSKKDNGNE